MTAGAEVPVSERSEGTETGAGASGASGGRLTQFINAVLRRARSKPDGDELFKKLRGDGAGATWHELGLPNTALATKDLEEVYRRCEPHWSRMGEKNVEYIVDYILEECASVMDSDRRFRGLQSKVGRRLHAGGVLTQDVLVKAQARCHDYWSRITPGNVDLIVHKIAGKCESWSEADKKFEFVWKKGQWSADKTTLSLAGRAFTAEDLEQAERRCRKKFGLDGKIMKRSPGQAGILPARPPDKPATPAPGEAPGASVSSPKRSLRDALKVGEPGAPEASQGGSKLKAAEVVQSEASKSALEAAAAVGTTTGLKAAQENDEVEAEAEDVDEEVENIDDGEDDDEVSENEEAEEECEADDEEAEEDLDGDEGRRPKHKSQSTATSAQISLPSILPLPPPAAPAVTAVPAVPAAPTVLAAPTVPAASTQPGLTDPSPAPQAATKTPSAGPSSLPKKVAASTSNVDFIVEHMLKKCFSADSSKKFFDWLRSDRSKIKGRVFSEKEVDEAEKRCHEIWGRQKAPSSGSSSNSSSDEAEKAVPGEAAGAREDSKRDREHAGDEDKPLASLRQSKAKASENEAVDNAEFIYQKVMSKCGSKSKAEKFFEKLHSTVGRISPLGRSFTEEEITEAYLRCTAGFEEKEAENNSLKKAKDTTPLRKATSENLEQLQGASKKDLSNTDLIVRQVLCKCNVVGELEKFFDMLHQKVGKKNPMGRIFTDEEVTEAWLRCTAFFEEQESLKLAAAEAENESSANDDSSDDDDEDDDEDSDEAAARKAVRAGGKGRKLKKGSSRDALGLKKPKKKDKKDKLRKLRSGMEEELEGALFGSDSEDLSGEEQVDEEEEGQLTAEMLADLGVGEGDEPEMPDDGYSADAWPSVTPGLKPGYEGFNARSTTVMLKEKVGATRLQVTFDHNAACPALQPHQESVAFLVHPKSPVTRLLVDHPTGSGKTREMIKVLDNYFQDPRPKVPIFPKDPVCRNFYLELLRWPNRYRDYFCCERPADAAIASGSPQWKSCRYHMWDLSSFPEEEVRRLGYSIREVLEMKGMFFMGKVRTSCRVAFHKKHPGEFMPLAPLRAIGYTSAGGSFSTLNENGKPASSIMKIGFPQGSTNVYTKKVVLMDEAHNLVRSQTQYAEQLQRLRNLLFTAKDLVLCGFTGTPILNEPSEGRQLLDIIKGVDAPEGDEGFLSSFPMRPQPLFPLSLPRGVPDGVLTLARKRQLIHKVELHGEALKIYDLKRRLALPPRRLRAYCNVSTFHATFHEGKHGTKVKVLTFPEDYCPKLYKIAVDIIASKDKAVVMTGRMSGHIIMLELMRFLAAKADPPFEVATMDELSEFNHVSNIRGERFRVLVADAAQCSEGVSFLAVRRTYLADVPVSPSAFIQQCGRAIRMYGHRGLPDEEQVVNNYLYVATMPKWMRASRLACWALRSQKKLASGKEVEKKGKLLYARLTRAGIRTLEELKAKIDAHGEEKRAAQAALDANPSDPTDPLMKKLADKAPLNTEDVLVFLEQHGLEEEAKLLRNADKKEKEKAMTAMASKESLQQAIEESQAPGDSMRLASTDSFDATAPLEKDADEEGLADDFAQALEDVMDEHGIAGTQPPEDAAAVGPEGSGVASAVAAVEPAMKAVAAALGVPEQVPEPEADAQRGLTPQEEEELFGEALASAKAACLAITRGPSTDAGAGGAGAAAEPAAEPAETDAGIPQWRLDFEAALTRSWRSPPVTQALRVAVHPAFGLDAPGANVRDLTQEQIKVLRDELIKFEKVKILKQVLTVLKGVRQKIEQGATAAAASQLDTLREPESSGLSAGVSTGGSGGMEAEAAGPSAGASTGGMEPEAAGNSAGERTGGMEPEAAGNSAGERTGGMEPEASGCTEPEASHPAVGANTGDMEPEVSGPPPCAEVEGVVTAVADMVPASVVAAAASRARQQAAKREWQTHLVDGLQDFRRSEYVRPLLKVVAPVLLEKDQGEEVLESLTEDQVRRLEYELGRLQEQAEQGSVKPRALVRAMQMLYMADSATDSALQLSVESADEEALRQLTECYEEFAPALKAMRSLAVDNQIFAHLAEQLDEEGVVEEKSESEASDIAKDLISLGEPAPIVLPPGWRLEWVKKKKRQMREWVDPEGQRYYNTREVRTALSALEARQAAEAAEASAPAQANKRMRLSKKTADPAKTDDFAEDLLGPGSLEAAFAEALDMEAELDVALADAGREAALPQEQASAPQAEPVVPSEPVPGAKISLKALVAKPELNGQLGRLVSCNEETGRWECHLDAGGKVNVKPANFTLLAGPARPARPKRSSSGLAAADEEPRRVRARGRGRGRGGDASPRVPRRSFPPMPAGCAGDSD